MSTAAAHGGGTGFAERRHHAILYQARLVDGCAGGFDAVQLLSAGVRACVLARWLAGWLCPPPRPSPQAARAVVLPPDIWARAVYQRGGGGAKPFGLCAELRREHLRQRPLRRRLRPLPARAHCVRQPRRNRAWRATNLPTTDHTHCGWLLRRSDFVALSPALCPLVPTPEHASPLPPSFGFVWGCVSECLSMRILAQVRQRPV